MLAATYKLGQAARPGQKQRAYLSLGESCFPAWLAGWMCANPQPNHHTTPPPLQVAATAPAGEPAAQQAQGRLWTHVFSCMMEAGRYEVGEGCGCGRVGMSG